MDSLGRTQDSLKPICVQIYRCSPHRMHSIPHRQELSQLLHKNNNRSVMLNTEKTKRTLWQVAKNAK